uniref:Putative reverse transcriptase and intron maturase n=1 Tax=Pyramimonas parkeae TaxID=36894 RepID=C0JX29_9CHLO|nr:putative reverse transcriptase and intron maturase [Pyramimonas parkeae]ACJ71149.1 putative reverse transcriptase and intron maturase [Pyramimonas parkeae]
MKERGGYHRMGQSILLRLESLKKRNCENKEAVNKDLYRLLCNKQLLTLAYNLIKSKPGNMTPGTDKLTLDKMSERLIDKTSRQLRDQTFKFKPVRRVFIPKGNSKDIRPLGVPSSRDKVVQKAMLLIMDNIYETTFSTHSHGFRPGRSCHSALKEIRSEWSGIKWAIEGDIKGCYDNVNHQILINILREKIKDERFIQLLWKLLRAGIEVNRTIERSKIGTPQGGILSPLLANIYLNEFDKFVSNLSQKIGLTYNKTRRDNPEYHKIRGKIYRLRTKRTVSGTVNVQPSKSDLKQIQILSKTQRTLPSKDPFDPQYRKILFIRYADDWIVGVIGGHEFAQGIKEQIQTFLKEQLELTLSPEKTKITPFSSKKVTFLGYKLQISARSSYSSSGRHKKRTVGWQPKLYIPMDKIVRKLSEKNFCTKTGTGIKKKGWILYPDKIIVQRYNYVIRGLRNYYAPADNFGTSMNRIEYILKYSCVHTLAAKHRTQISTQLERTEELGLDTMKSHKNNIWDFKTKPVQYNQLLSSYVKRTQLLSASECTICQSKENLEMHHVKALRKDGALLSDKYMIALMQRMNRKQICVCRTCHMDIHYGKYDGNSLSIIELE